MSQTQVIILQSQSDDDDDDDDDNDDDEDGDEDDDDDDDDLGSAPFESLSLSKKTKLLCPYRYKRADELITLCTTKAERRC